MISKSNKDVFIHINLMQDNQPYVLLVNIIEIKFNYNELKLNIELS